MNRKEIHIVSFDVPFTPDYGGVIDVYNRSKALKEAGFKVVLHVFEYGRGRNHEFYEIADSIFYYNRSSFLKSFLQVCPPFTVIGIVWLHFSRKVFTQKTSQLSTQNYR